ncbi:MULTISPECIES: putative bifunctional diguanylate cyclase/phosphodiesterase [Nocardioides]|uniref:Bifunctional diguanylate cyclase/phosphodiesterase n=1 Tax=Nocardioides vastitatis TaxID=2568655 RepID=A0ABW0ZDG4_9ACTN|nr:EAL domain-containing protein [Nocardioides sp.]THJ08631.1 EAL domain-containing protein [Nocardioides sp.]
MGAADAAASAALDTAAVARRIEDLTVAAQEAASGADGVASQARYATAATVAAAASAAAQVAAETAAAVQTKAEVQASNVAAAAVAALESIAVDLPQDVDPAWARRAASTVAFTVAAEVIAQAQLADDAATTVSDAVALAAEGAALAALAAASIVGGAAHTAGEVAREVANSSREARTASTAAVESTARVADLAMRRATLLHRAPLAIELGEALEQGQLRLHYQPVYSMETGALVAVEALLRWQHPTRGMLPPAEFLDVAEGPQLITPIGDWVLETAADQSARWQRDLGERAPRMWVNVSCEQFGRHHLVGLFKQLLEEHQLRPGSLGIEVTERQLARRMDDVESDLNDLRDLQVPTAVDDFGTGYASLDYLRRFTFDEIKIDRSFVAGLPAPVNTAIISSIIALGTSLGMSVVAEGVETPHQYDLLKALGCGFSQGYLFHRPAPADALSALLRG